jgi:hypothetical protein
MMARIETPRGPYVRSSAVQSPGEVEALDLINNPSRGLGYGQGAGGRPEISGTQFSLMMDKIRDMERDRDVLREKNDIVGALKGRQNQMHQILRTSSMKMTTIPNGVGRPKGCTSSPTAAPAIIGRRQNTSLRLNQISENHCTWITSYHTSSHPRR